MPSRLVLAALLIALGAGAAAAQSYLPQGAAPDARRYLPPPPPVGSAAERAERETFLATRKLKDGGRWALATSDVPSQVKPLLADFGCALGVRQLDDQTAPALMTLLTKSSRDLRAVVDPPKQYWKRKRPFVGTHQTICVPVDDSLTRSGSYPSGHSTSAWTMALILAELAPDRATELFTRARVFGESRVVCGVHFPSDVEAGRTTASAIVAVLHSSPEFRADMDKARAELAAARQAGGAAPDPAQCRPAEDAATNRGW